MKDYKKILEGVVNIINTTEKSDIGFANICTYIGENCPELKESEDERIRKVLVELVKCNEKSGYFMFNNITTSSMLAWLEKQGEQKPAIEMKSAEESLGIDSETYNKIVDECIYGEQKPADKVESNKKFTPIESALKDLICDVDNSYTIEQVRRFLFEYGYKDKILNAAQEEMQKPAWSEEDENRINRLIAYFEDKESFTAEDDIAYANWLKSLKSRVQPKQEWSEEDKVMLKEALRMIESPGSIFKGEILTKKVADWLKSLKPRNRWKPSDEQMEALDRAQAELCNTEYNKPICDLIDSLKKLKE